MCKSMRIIKNPKFKNNTFKLGVDPTYIRVGCGVCIECRTKKVNDLIVRAYMEFCEMKRLGGFTYMTSFTYNPDHVPMYDGLMCFKKSDFADFFKRLKTNLKRRYNIEGVRCIATSEYGKNTQRPHYHGLFFVPTNKISPFRFYCELKDAWCSGSTSMGFIDRFKRTTEIVNGIRINASVVDSVYGIRYVCKYLCKDFDIEKVVKRYSNSGFSKLYRMQKDETVDPLVDISRCWKAYSYMRSGVDPTVLDYSIVNYAYVSHGLGMSFLEGDYNEILSFIKSYISIPAKTKTGQINLAVPYFYIRKLFYTYNKSTKRYVPNDLFHDYQSVKYLKFSEYLENQSHFLKYYDDAFKRVQELMASQNITLKGVVNYMFFLRGRSFDAHSYFLVPDPECVEDMNTLFERNINVLVSDHLGFLPDVVCKTKWDHYNCIEYDWNNYPFDYFHEHPKYAPYEEIASIFDDISERLKKKKIEDAELEEKLDRAWQALKPSDAIVK